MLDGEIPAMVTVWGIPVPILPDGRRAWPDTLREMVVTKVLAGAAIKQTANEIGTNKSVVVRWVREARSTAPATEFIELIAPTQVSSSRDAAQQVAAPVPRAADLTSNAECRISIGDADITIPAGYPAAHLAEVLRAVREL